MFDFDLKRTFIEVFLIGCIAGAVTIEVLRFVFSHLHLGWH